MRLVVPVLVLAICLNAGRACGQAKSGLPRFQADSVQAQTRLAAIEDRVRPGAQSETIALLVGAADPWPGLTAAAALQTVDDEAWERSLSECIELVRELGDGLTLTDEASPISLTPPPHLSVRRRIAQLIASFPASVRSRYRAQVEKQARDLLAQGRSARSPQPLLRLVDEFFASDSSVDALAWLGDLAFFRGDMHEALAWWRLLAPLPGQASDDDSPLRHPDAHLDLPLLRTKQVLALACLGRVKEARQEVEALGRLHPMARVKVDGGLASPAALLDDLLTRLARADDLPPRDDWPTLGGSASGQAIVSRFPAPRLWLDGATWKAALPAEKKLDEPLERPQARVHPVIVGDRVVVVDGKSVTVHDLRTGEKLFHQAWPVAQSPSPEIASYTASGERDFVVFRIGRPPDRSEHIKKPMETTWLARLDLADGIAKSKRVRWEVGVPAEKAEDASFNGPPVVHQGRVWAPYQEWRGARLMQGIASLNAETGRWLSNVVLCDVPPLPKGREGPRQPVLLGVAGNIIVCCTQAGAIAGVDGRTGQVAWGVRYPTQGPWTRLTTPSVRDLAAPLYEAGRVCVAPQDTDLLYCLDAQTGRVLWEREALDVVHLLGIADGKLVFTTATGLRAIAAATGSDRDGWLLPDIGALAPAGRGVILGDWVLWPTADPRLPMRAVCIATGTQQCPGAQPPLLCPTMLRNLGAGNVVFGRGSLLIASDAELTAFVRPALLLDARRAQNSADRTQLSDFLLAAAEADAGQRDAALERLRKLIVAGTPPWESLAQERLSEMLMEWADAAERHGTPAERAGWLWKAADAWLSPRQRAQALVRLWKLYDKLDDAAGKEKVAAILDGDARLLREESRAGSGTLDLETAGYFRITDRKARRAAAEKAWTPPPTLTSPLREAGRFRGALVPWRETRLALVDDWILVAHEGEVRCVNAATGKTRWTTPWTGPLPWAARTEQLVFLAGPDLVQAISPDNGKVHWTFENPSRRLERHVLTDGVPTLVEEEGGFDGFTLTDWFLLIRHDSRRVFLLYHEFSQPGLTLGAPRLTSADVDRFPAAPSAADDQALVLDATGELSLLEESTFPGIVTRRWRFAAPGTLAPPGKGLTLVGQPRGQVIAWDTAKGREVWRYEPASPVSLTGAPPRLFNLPLVSLAIVPRSLADEVVALDRASGKPLWQRADLDLDARFAVQSLSWDNSRVFLVPGTMLRAVDARTGKDAWQAPLPSAANWTTLYTPNLLVAHPRGERLVCPPVLRAFPALALGWQAANPIAQERADFLVFDPAAGKLLQRIKLEGGPGPFRAQAFRSGLVLSDGREAVVFLPGL